MNKIIFTLTMALVCSCAATAQYGTKTFSKRDTAWTVTYFTSGQKSTETFNLASDTRWHHLRAYDKTGKVIYETGYGQKHGSSSVELKYFPNGGIYMTHYTMQPDGGIQHTDIRTYYTAEGKVDHVEDNSTDGTGQMHLRPVFEPQTQMPVVTPKQNPKPNECAPVPPATEVYLINYTSERLHIRALYKDVIAGPSFYDIEPSDTVRLGIHYASNVANPLDHYKLEVETKPRYDFQYRVANAGSNGSNKQYVMVTCRRIRR